MISYEKLKNIHDEIKNEHKRIQTQHKKQTLEFKNTIKTNYPSFSTNYPNLLNRIIDKNYQKSLNKIVPAILKLHKVQKVKVEVEKIQPPIDASFDKISVTVKGTN